VLCSKNAGATDEDIALLLGEKEVRVPQDYLTLLKHFNGCILFKYNDLEVLNSLERKTSKKRQNCKGNHMKRIGIIL